MTEANLKKNLMMRPAGLISACLCLYFYLSSDFSSYFEYIEFGGVARSMLATSCDLIFQCRKWPIYDSKVMTGSDDQLPLTTERQHQEHQEHQEQEHNEHQEHSPHRPRPRHDPEPVLGGVKGD